MENATVRRDGPEMICIFALFLDRNSEADASVMDLVGKLENLWVGKSTDVPKTSGLT